VRAARALLPYTPRAALGAAIGLAVCAAAACGLSVDGTAGDPNAGSEGGLDVPIGADAGSLLGDSAPSADGALASDAVVPDGPNVPDAPHEASCVPFDAGLTQLTLASFSLKGNAVYNENADGRITLTNSNMHERGAAWYPAPLPVSMAYDATWSLRVGPSDTAGDGIAFAVLETSGLPGVGDEGDGIGLRNLAPPDGGTLAGYAVIVDMFKATGDVTDVGPTTLKIVVMPGFRFVATVALPATLNDGMVYSVDVSWRAPTLTATLHGPGGVAVHAASNDPSLALSAPALVGFAGATGGASDSHNEIVSGSITATCD
jgi:hypothetical protein